MKNEILPEINKSYLKVKNLAGPRAIQLNNASSYQSQIIAKILNKKTYNNELLNLTMSK